MIMKDHQISELVNNLRDAAVKYHDKQCLRGVISRLVNESLKDAKENKQ